MNIFDEFVSVRHVHLIGSLKIFLDTQKVFYFVLCSLESIYLRTNIASLAAQILQKGLRLRCWALGLSKGKD